MLVKFAKVSMPSLLAISAFCRFSKPDKWISRSRYLHIS